MSTKMMDQVLSAMTPADLFDMSDMAAAKKTYRKFARTLHPDMFPEGNVHKKKAAQAFAHLTTLWARVEDATTPGNTVRTRRHEYSVGSSLVGDEVFARFEATYDAGHQSCHMVVARSVRDSDLVGTHVSRLRKLREVPENYRVFFPELIEQFRYRQSDGDHAALTIKPLAGFYTLRQVMERYPDGISGRDVAWMFRRMLVALGNGHDLGLVHGAPTLDAFWIHPEMHGVVLDSWQYSVETSQPLKAVPSQYKSWYPQYALDKEPVDFRLDLAIASRVANELLGAREPKALRAFFKGCQVTTPPPARYLLAEFDDLLERLYGERSFHKFTME